MDFIFRPLKFIIPLFSLILWFSCNQKSKVDLLKNPEAYKAYINGFTSGNLARNESVKIFLNQSLPDSTNLPALNSIWSFSPSLKGEYKWLNAYSLEFIPEHNAIDPTKTYISKLNLKAIFKEVADSISYLEFPFQFEELHTSIQWSYLRPDLSNPSQMYLEGTIEANDVLSDEQIKSMIRVNSKAAINPQITIEHDPIVNTRQKIRFSPFARPEVGTSLTMEWKSNLNTDDFNQSQLFDLPGLHDFVVTGVEKSTETQKSINIYFSDPLDPNQDIRGLISIQPDTSKPRIQKQNEVITLYLQDNATPKELKLKIAQGILSAGKRKLNKDFIYPIDFASEKPAIRFADDGTGSILPYSENLIMPIEVMNLKSFDVEIFKIFSNNVLYNLHLNEYNDDYTMVKLGRIILQQHIAINNRNQVKDEWIPYALNLNQLIKPDPGAIYEVRLTFKPTDTDYGCASANTELPESYGNYYSGDPAIKSNWVEWYPYDEEEENRDPDDPCSYNYYRAEHFARRSILASNIALSVKSSDNGNQAYAAVQNILDAKPVQGAEVTFYDKQLQIIATAKTDGNGIVLPDVDRKPHIVFAKSGNNFAYLKLSDGKALSISEFDVSGTSSVAGLKASIYTERGIWRPGDTIFLNVILSQNNKTIPDQFPVELQLKNPQGQLIKKLMASAFKFGLYTFQIPTKFSDITGVYNATIKAGLSTFNKPLRVETVKPNRFKVDWTFDPSDNILAPNAKNTMQASWLFGTPASNVDADVEVTYAISEPVFKSFKDYNFLDPELQKYSGSIEAFKGKLNDQGKSDIKFSDISNTIKSGNLNLNIISKISDASGDISTDYFPKTISPFKEYVGVKIPNSDYGKKLDMGKPQSIQFVVVNEKGDPVANRELSVELYNVEWEWWYEVNHGSGEFSHGNQKTFVETRKIKTNANGIASASFTLNTYDRFYIAAKDLNNNYITGDYFYTGWPYDENGEGKEYANMMMFASDKEKYNLGEKAKVMLPEQKMGYT